MKLLSQPKSLFFSLVGFGLTVILLLTMSGVQANDDVAADQNLRLLLDEANVQALRPLPKQSSAKIELGRFLFFDPILSGNKDISCATCHHPDMHTADALALSIGVGGDGLGTNRIADAERERVPRNAPELFNRGVDGWHTMFWDNRIFDSATQLVTPAAEDLPEGLDNMLAAQALFPVTSRDEMRGLAGDQDIFGKPNELALLEDTDFTGIWNALLKRISSIPAYKPLFQEAYPDLQTGELSIQHIGNAIAAFEASEWTLLDSPFDLYLAGNNEAMSLEAKEGALLFYGKAGCSGCHSGSLLTDQKTHNIAIPPLGPGKSGSEIDFGVELLSKDKSDRCAFRTPPLRNVTLTGPWMHNGAYTSLEDVIWHHLDPEAALRIYDVGQLEPALRHTVKRETHIQETLLANLDVLLSSPKALTSNEIGQVLAFLEALTSPSAVDLAGSRPDFVPSGLPFD